MVESRNPPRKLASRQQSPSYCRSLIRPARLRVRLHIRRRPAWSSFAGSARAPPQQQKRLPSKRRPPIVCPYQVEKSASRQTNPQPPPSSLTASISSLLPFLKGR